MTGSVFISGPASWNRIVYLEHLPDPVPHMQFALEDYETLGGTSAGKALGLVGLGRNVVLHTHLGSDLDGTRVRSALEETGVALIAVESAVTERHLNLMTRAGERVSLYLSTPDGPAHGNADSDTAAGPDLTRAMEGAAALVLDLAGPTRTLLPAAQATGVPIWTDVHDYDGSAEFHRPFIAAAEAIFLNADRIGSDPFPFMERCIRDGARLVVCTLGADGAIAVDEHLERHAVAAAPVEVVDTNGAGDAFLSGVLDAHLDGAGLPDALHAGAMHAASVLRTRHLHPRLDALLGR